MRVNAPPDSVQPMHPGICRLRHDFECSPTANRPLQLTSCGTCSATEWRSKASSGRNAPRLTGQRAPSAANTSGWRQHQPQAAPRPAAQHGSHQPAPPSPIRAHGHPQGQGRQLHSGGEANGWSPAPSKSRGRAGRGRTAPATSCSSPRNQQPRPAVTGALPPRTPGPEHAPRIFPVLRHDRLASRSSSMLACLMLPLL